MVTTFEIGKKYENRKGVFEVTLIEDSKVYIKYIEDNSTAKLDINIASNLCSPFNGDVPLPDVACTDNGTLFYSSLGYLCKHGNISCSITHNSKKEFDDTYYNIKGKLPNGEKKTGYCVHPLGVNKWGIRIGICFKDKDKVNIPDMKVTEEEKQFVIYSKEFGFKLFSIGFDLGRNHDYKEILSNVPYQYKEVFNKEYNAD
jgi:hypothetical protein